MRCPQCNTLIDSHVNQCTGCGYRPTLRDSRSWYLSTRESVLRNVTRQLSGSLFLSPTRQAPCLPVTNPHHLQQINDHRNSYQSITSPLLNFSRNDVLKGRYRLGEAVQLPKNQQSRTLIRYATDLQADKQRVIVRQIQLLSYEKPQVILDTITEKFKYASQHPGITPIVDSFYERGYCYFVQPVPIGESLATLMQQRDGALPEHLVVEYGKQLCQIATLLEKAPQPIVHGAISPQTIIIDQENHRVSLIYLPLLPPSLRPEDNPAGYIPSEQVHRQIIPSSDLYAIAATMHHAVTGYSPHDRLVHFFPPARRLNPKVTAELEEILSHQLRLSIRQRYPNAQSMLNSLNKLLTVLPKVEVSQKTSAPLIPLRRASLWSSFRRKPIQMLLLAVICLILIIVLMTIGISTYVVRNSTHLSQAAYTQQLQVELESFQKQGIGISDGRMIFDSYKGRLNTALKARAASAIQTGDMSTAANLFHQAVSVDPSDGEAQIYNEDIRILQANAPYVTIVVGLPIESNDVYLNSARVQLQAVYLAQHKINSQSQLPNGLKLRVLIANSGANNDNVGTVAKFIANRVSRGGNPDRIISVIGWPSSSQTLNARNILAGAHIPLISQTDSSVKSSGSSPYFFRVCPVDDAQGRALGAHLVNEMKVRNLLVLSDPHDQYSVSLANAVAGSAHSLGATINTGTFTETKTTVDQFQQFTDRAVNEQDDAIFLAGLSADAVRLAHAIGEASRANPNNQILSSLEIIGGHSLTDTVLFGVGNNDDAQIARTYPQDMRRITATTFADASAWSFLRIAQNKQPSFFSDWAATYQGSTIGSNTAAPTQEGILIYDVVGVVIHAASKHPGTPTGEMIQRTLSILGKGSVAGYQGVSGYIEFDSQGNPIDKVIIIVAVQDDDYNKNKLFIKKIIGRFE